jgi:NADH-quinone oxidoreductase subunit E
MSEELPKASQRASEARPPRFSERTRALIDGLIARYPEGRQKSALLPVLHLAQMEFDGWLSVPVMDHVASVLEIAPIEVYEVASFYSMFNLEPVGNCVLEVCHTGPCWLSGAEELVRHLESRLGIRAGETSPDGLFTLKTVECLAACGTAPIVQVGETYHENVTPEGADRILAHCRERGCRATHWDRRRVEAT